MTKPWEQDWSQADETAAKPWEQDWSQPPQQATQKPWEQDWKQPEPPASLADIAPDDPPEEKLRRAQEVAVQTANQSMALDEMEPSLRGEAPRIERSFGIDLGREYGKASWMRAAAGGLTMLNDALKDVLEPAMTLTEAVSGERPWDESMEEGLVAPHIIRDFQRTATQMERDIYKRIQERGGISKLEEAKMSAMQSLYFMAPMMAAAIVTRSSAVGGYGAGVSETMRSYGENLSLGIPKERAFQHALTQGAIEGLGEMASMSKFLNIFTGIKNPIAKRVKDWVLTELVTELGQESGQALSDEIYGMREGMSLQEWGDLWLLTSLSTAMVGGTLGGVSGSIQKLRETAQAYKEDQVLREAVREMSDALVSLDEDIDSGLLSPMDYQQSVADLRPLAHMMLEAAKNNERLQNVLDLDRLERLDKTNLEQPGIEISETDVTPEGEVVLREEPAEDEVVRELDEIVPEDETGGYISPEQIEEDVMGERAVEVDVFHGTSQPIEGELDPRRAIETEGAIFFADNEDVAYTFTLPREYGEPVYYDEAGNEIEPGTVEKRRIRLKNPMVLKGEEAQNFIEDTAKQARTVAEAKKRGHDGIIAENVLEGIGERYEGNVYAVFSADAIKRLDQQRERQDQEAIERAKPLWEARPDDFDKPKTKSMERFLEKNRDKVTGLSIEPDGVFIYTDSRQWSDDAGAGTFRGDTETAAIRRFNEMVQPGLDNVTVESRRPEWLEQAEEDPMGRIDQLEETGLATAPEAEDMREQAEPGRWRIWDRKEKKWASAPYNSRKRARARADRLDNEYGAYRYQVRRSNDEPGTFFQWKQLGTVTQDAHDGYEFTAPLTEDDKVKVGQALDTLPPMFSHMVDSIGILKTDEPNTLANYTKPIRRVRMTRRAMDGVRWAFDFFHEIGHAVDMWWSGTTPGISNQSPLYKIDFVKNEAGPAVLEAFETYAQGFQLFRKVRDEALKRGIKLGRHDREKIRKAMVSTGYSEKEIAKVLVSADLSYPLASYSASAKAHKDAAELGYEGHTLDVYLRQVAGVPDTYFFQYELFAQQFALYHTDRRFLELTMPRTLAAMEEIHEIGQSALDIGTANAGVWQALRASRPRSGYTGVEQRDGARTRRFVTARSQRGPPGQSVARTDTDSGYNGPDRRNFLDRSWRRVAAAFSWASPTGTMEHVRLYLKYRNLYQGQLTRARQLTERFVQLFDGVHPEVGKGIYNYLTQKGVKPSDMIPREKGQSQEDYETLLKRAAATKRLIRNVGRELVKAGLLEENVFEANKDSYLPRIYLKYLIGDEGSQQLSNHGRLDLNYLKKRKDIPGWMREVFMGQIYEPGLLVPMMVGRSQRDIALHSFMEKIAGNQDWVAQATLLEYPVPDTENPNDYQRYTEDNPELGVAAGDPVTIKITPQYAIKEAERIENTLDKYDPSVRGSAAFLAANLKMFANDHLAQTRTKFDTKHYKQIPDSARYGHLRGAWVRKEIANDLMGALSIDQGDDYLQWMINKAQHVTGRWKVHKVAMNPPTIARNLMSNAMLLQMSGMPLFTPSKYNVAKMMFVDSIGEIRNNGKYYKIFTKYGGQESTFSNQELTRLTREFRRQYTGKGGNALYMLHKISDTVYGTAGDFYQLLETMGKVAKIKYEMEVNGLAEDDAMIEANKWLFDYSHVPRTVETLRKIPFGIPFLTFYYKATARVAETMIRYPHRMLPWVSVHYAMYAAAMAMMDDVDWEDLTQARMALPYFMRERGGMLPMPFRDANGKIQFLDMSYIYPWGMPMNILLQAKQGDTAGVLTQFGLGGSPILQQFAGHLTGYHPFYQKPIYDGMYLEKAGFRVNEADKLAAYLKFAWNIWAPGPMTVDPGNPFYKMKLAVEGEATGYGDLPPTIGQATARMGGLNLYPVDAKEDAMQNIGYMTYIIGEYRRKMTNKIANARNDREREKLTREMNSQLEQLTEDLNEYKQRAGID